MVKSMDKAIGRKMADQIQISIKVTTIKTKSMATVSFFGSQEANIREITIMIKRKDMEKCIG